MYQPVEAGFRFIPISAILSYLPHGRSEGWNSEIFRLFNNVVKFVKHREFRGVSFGTLNDHSTFVRPLYFANFEECTPENFPTSIPYHSAFRTLLCIFAFSYDPGGRFSRLR